MQQRPSRTKRGRGQSSQPEEACRQNQYKAEHFWNNHTASKETGINSVRKRKKGYTSGEGVSRCKTLTLCWKLNLKCLYSAADLEHKVGGGVPLGHLPHTLDTGNDLWSSSCPAVDFFSAGQTKPSMSWPAVLRYGGLQVISKSCTLHCTHLLHAILSCSEAICHYW